MSGLSSGTYSWGGDAGRCLGGGDGERLLKNLSKLPFLDVFFDAALGAFADSPSTGISSSVGGAEDSAESSESDMLICCCPSCSVVVVVVGVDVGRHAVDRLGAV